MPAHSSLVLYLPYFTISQNAGATFELLIFFFYNIYLHPPSTPCLYMSRRAIPVSIINEKEIFELP
jgi:hypothetical protein